MNSPGKCNRRPIDAHFKGRTNQAQEKSMREHLIQCDSCRDYYRRKLLFAELDPGGLDSQTRLAQGLDATHRIQMLRPVAVAAAVSVAIVMLVIWGGMGSSKEGGAFAVRGAAPAGDANQLLVYRVPHDGKPSMADAVIYADDELAFAYENGNAKKYLLVLGIDEDDRIFWYHPEWKTPKEDPSAKQISSSEGIHELPEAIRHRLRGKSLRIVGIFTDRRITASRAETMVRSRKDADKLLSGDGDIWIVHEFMVRH